MIFQNIQNKVKLLSIKIKMNLIIFKMSIYKTVILIIMCNKIESITEMTSKLFVSKLIYVLIL